MAEPTLIPVPPGRLAAIVTYLEMTAPPDILPPDPPAPGLALCRVNEPSAAWYRALFRAIGEDWLWYSRLKLADGELLTVLRDPRVEVYALYGGGREVGLLELDRRDAAPQWPIVGGR